MVNRSHGRVAPAHSFAKEASTSLLTLLYGRVTGPRTVHSARGARDILVLLCTQEGGRSFPSHLWHRRVKGPRTVHSARGARDIFS